MKHNRKDYFSQKNYKYPSKFDMLFESIMDGTPIFEDIKANPIPIMLNKELSLITEEICKPVYVVSESTGDCILLEEAIFYSESQLICEGILDKVFDKIKELYEKIKAGIMKVLSEASDAIKAFCEKVMNSKIVMAIRKKLNLDSKINKESFANAYKLKDAKGNAIAAEAVLNGTYCDGQIISEANLSKKELAMSPEEIKEQIEYWKKVKAGEIEKISKKTGKQVTSSHCQDRITKLTKLLKEKTKSEGSSSSDASSDKPATTNAPDTSASSSDESSDKPASSESEDKPKSGDAPIGTIVIKSKEIKAKVSEVGEECTSDESATAASKSTAVAEGGEEAKAQLSGEGEEDKEKEKKSFFNKIGNFMKDKIVKMKDSVKNWYAKQNKWMKMLIWAIIVIIAIFAVWYLITAIIMPVLYGLLHGGLLNAGAGIFKLVSAGKTFQATYKSGQKAWETGTGWGKFFLLLGGSILACITIGQMASQGQAMMDAAKVDTPSTHSETSSNSTRSNKGAGGKGMTGDEVTSHEYKDQIKLSDGRTAHRVYDDPYANSDGKIAYSVKTPGGSQTTVYLDGTNFKQPLSKQIESFSNDIHIGNSGKLRSSVWGGDRKISDDF